GARDPRCEWTAADVCSEDGGENRDADEDRQQDPDVLGNVPGGLYLLDVGGERTEILVRELSESLLDRLGREPLLAQSLGHLAPGEEVLDLGDVGLARPSRGSLVRFRGDRGREQRR